MNVPMVYNIILGHPTLNTIKVVVAPYLLLIQFEVDDGKVSLVIRSIICVPSQKKHWWHQARHLSSSKPYLHRTCTPTPLACTSALEPYVIGVGLFSEGLHLFLIAFGLLPDGIKLNLYNALKKKRVNDGESVNCTLNTRKEKTMASQIKYEGKD
ncbi:hypothetical protein Cgig2_014879 [Carnegiea gigantea]|uniref:Uncharacterized protein n=1 Tax=Carnegiea gigantea TaxID=171969 RepID=A0A9Q1JN86_9CARY|nr:hypothetical protein Cgig2_014879 [Carnegiea gigantea]